MPKHIHIPTYFWKHRLLFLCGIFLFLSVETHAHEVASNGQIWFVPNKGQWQSEVLFRAETNNATLFYDRDGYVIFASKPLPHAIPERADVPNRLQGHITKVTFKNSLPPKSTFGIGKAEWVQHYYLGNDPTTWRSNVPVYAGFVRQEIYPGIDWKVKQAGSSIKSEFVIKSGSKPEQIVLQYDGADYLKIRNGTLVIGTSMGEITEAAPLAWQEIDGQIVDVPCRFQVKGKQVMFHFPKGYNPKYDLIIDPEIIFYTYSGAGSDNWGSSATYDKEGNAYHVSTIFGRFYPTTVGAFDRTYNGSGFEYVGFDIGVMKFDSTGSKLIYSSFLGGSQGECPHSAVVDNQGNLIIYGTTSSSNFPTTAGAFQRNFKGSGEALYPLTPTSIEYAQGSDIFVTKFNASGSALLASTFISGNGIDGCIPYGEALNNNYGDAFRGEVEVDNDGFIYIAGSTTSPNFPALNGFKTIKSNGRDGIVVKFNPALSAVVWSTFIGGDNSDAIFSLEIDAFKQVYVCGATLSSNLPTGLNAVQPNYAGNIDGFVCKISADGSTLLGSTYLGGPAYDAAFLLALDQNGLVYVMGQTRSTLPRTQGVYGHAAGGQFLQCFTNGLNSLAFATTFGLTPNTPNLVPTAMMVNDCNQIFITGWGGLVNRVAERFLGGSTSGLPVTSDAFQRSTDGSDFYMMVLTEGARSLRYATFLGQNGGRGEHVDGGTSRFDKKYGIVYQAVCGCLGDSMELGFPGTPGAYSRFISSNNCNAATLKFSLGEPKAKFGFVASTKCGAPVQFTNLSINGITHVWYFGNGDSLRTNQRTISYQYKQPGTYVVTIKALNPLTCTKFDTYTDTIVIANPFNFEPDTLKTLICRGDTFQANLDFLADYQVQWSPTRYLSNPNIINPVIKPEGSILYTILVRNADGCEAKTYFQLINRKVNLSITDSIINNFCEGTAEIWLKASGDSSEYYRWQTSAGHTGEGKYFKIYTDKNLAGLEVSLEGAKDGCGEKVFKTLNIALQKIPIKADFEIKQFYDNCTVPGLQVVNNSQGGINFLWDFGDGKQVRTFETTHLYPDTGTYHIRLIAENSRCYDTVVKTISIKPFLAPNLITANTDGKNEALTFNNWEPGWKLEIYNRWGRRIFFTDNYQNNWIPPSERSGTYFYAVTFPNGKACKAWLQVVR